MSRQSCEQLQESLPWLVNGTLPGGERQSLLEHVGNCSECAAVHRIERHVCEAVTAPGNNVTHPARFGWQKLEARLDAQPPIDSQVADLVVAPTRASRGRSRQRTRLIWFAIAAQAAAIAVLALALWVKLPEEAAYRTVSAPAVALAPAVAEGLLERREYLRIALDPRSNIARGHELAQDIGADLVAGPSANNIYTFVLNTSRREQAGAAMQWLRRQPDVLLVEPLRVEPSRIAPLPAPVAQ